MSTTGPIQNNYTSSINQISTQQSEYETDDTSISPTSTWWSSRRSSSSSLSSSVSDHLPSRNACNIKSSTSIHVSNQCELNQYEFAFHKMTRDINHFLIRHQNNAKVNPTSSIENSNELKEMISLLESEQETILSHDEVTQLLKFIENWICATQDKEVIENVFEQDCLMKQNKRLINDLQRLGKQHGEMKKRVKVLERHVLKLKEEKKRDLKKFQMKVDKSAEDKIEAEQLLDDMRREMEDMMEELDGVKQQSEQYREKSDRLEKDVLAVSSGEQTPQDVLLREANTRIEQLEESFEDRTIKLRELENTFNKNKTVLSETHKLQVAALTFEKEELRQRLIKAEQSSANYAQSLEIEKKKVKSDTDLENALRRYAAEKEKELAKVIAESEKSQRHVDQMKTYYDKQLKQELKAREDEMREKYESQYRQQTDTFQVRVTRDLREMAGKMAELEIELENLEQQNEWDKKALENIRKGHSESDEALQNKISSWTTIESEFESKIASLEGRVISLEKEVLVLYSKNLELARQLGELEP